MANEAVVDIKANNSKLESDLNESEALVKQFAGGVKLALAAVAGAFVFDAIRSSIGGWISDASKAEDATAKLSALIDSTGGTAGYTADQLAQMADELEKLTGIEAEATQQAQALLLTFDNVRGDQFQRATELAADLAKTLGTDITGAAKMVGKALDDPVDAVNALSRAGIDFTAEQKEMIQSLAETGDVVAAQEIILDALQGKVGGVAEALGQTFGGRVEILNAKLGDLGETVATALIPYIEALLPAAEIAIGGFQEILNILAEFTTASDEFNTSFADTIVEAFRYVMQIGVDAFTYLQASLETWSMSAERDTLAVFLSFTTLFEDLKHWFTEAVPAYLKWFGENWSNIWTDVSNYTSTVLTNMWSNVKNFFTNVWKWLKGEETSFEWKGLTEGFEATTKELPEIAKRSLTDTEKYLTSSISQMDKEIAATFEKRKAEGDAFVEKMFAREPKKKTDFETTESKERRKLGKKEEEKKPEDQAAKAPAPAPAPAPAAPTPAASTAGQTVGVEELYKRISEASAKAPEMPVDAMMQANAINDMFNMLPDLQVSQDQQLQANDQAPIKQDANQPQEPQVSPDARAPDKEIKMKEPVFNIEVPAMPDNADVPVKRQEMKQPEVIDYTSVFNLMVTKLTDTVVAVDRVTDAVKELEIGAVV